MNQSHLLSTLSPILIPSSVIPSTPPIIPPSVSFSIFSPSIPIRPSKGPRFFTTVLRSQSTPNPQLTDEEEDDDDTPEVEDLRVPNHWLLPAKAIEESEWLKVTLHKWLDDEYCPEETNVEISKVAAQSYHESLVGKRTDLGDILLNMAKDLESISYQESFHGAFSSANAAVSLIVQRIELEGKDI